jgi:hypothetical protein
VLAILSLYSLGASRSAITSIPVPLSSHFLECRCDESAGTHSAAHNQF